MSDKTRAACLFALFGRVPPGKTCVMSDWIDSEGYRANVGIVLMRDSGEVFLGQRTGARGWQFPQGGVRQGEPVEHALYRELQEEIGLQRAARDARGVHRRLDPLPAAEALRASRARSHLHRPEAALVPAAARGAGRRGRVQFHAHQRAGIRRLALGKLLGAGARSDLLQAAGVCAHADRACAGRISRRAAAAAGMVANRKSPRPWKTEVTMPGLPPKLVVTTYAPTRRWITIVLLRADRRGRRLRHVRVRPLPRRIRCRRGPQAARRAAQRDRRRRKPRSPSCAPRWRSWNPPP